jgi:hypothetical protein
MHKIKTLKNIISVLLAGLFMVILTSCTAYDQNVGNDYNADILKEYNKACKYAAEHGNLDISNHASETYTESILALTEITPEAKRNFKSQNFGNLNVEPVVFLDDILEGTEGVQTYFCKAAPGYTKAADDPYWSLVIIDEESKKYKESVALDIPGSVLLESVSNLSPKEYRNFGTWNFPKSYELTAELTEKFNEAVDNDEINGFVYTPLIKLGSGSSRTETAYAVLSLKELKEKEYRCFCVVYIGVNGEGRTRLLNSSIVVY